MKKKKGQAVLEMALVLPIMLLVFCAIIDFGRILYTSASLNLVSQEAVRLAGLGKSDSEVYKYVYDKTYLNDKNLMERKLTPDETLRKSGDYVTLEIKYPIKYITPLMSKFLPSPYKVYVKSVIRVE